MTRMTHPLEVVLDEKFWAKVEKQADGCWLWRGARNKSGHGQMTVSGRRHPVHRVVHERLVAEIPDAHDVHHECSTRACVNPAHLRALPRDAHNRMPKRRAVRTHCRYGHELTLENTYVRPDGSRVCRTCIRAASQRYKTRVRAGAEARRSSRSETASCASP